MFVSSQTKSQSRRLRKLTRRLSKVIRGPRETCEAQGGIRGQNTEKMPASGNGSRLLIGSGGQSQGLLIQGAKFEDLAQSGEGTRYKKGQRLCILS